MSDLALQIQYAGEMAVCQFELLTEATTRAREAFIAITPVLEDIARRMPELRFRDFVERRERRLASRYWRTYVARGRRAAGRRGA